MSKYDHNHHDAADHKPDDDQHHDHDTPDGSPRFHVHDDGAITAVDGFHVDLVGDAVRYFAIYRDPDVRDAKAVEPVTLADFFIAAGVDLVPDDDIALD